MAINRGTKSLTVSTEERTWRVNIETPLGGDPVVTVWRELVTKDAEGNIIAKVPSETTSRSLSKVIAGNFHFQVL